MNDAAACGDWRGRKILITGGAGMIGSAVARLSAAAGARVTVVDSFAPLYGGNRFNLRGIAGLRVVHGDIRDKSLMSRLVRGRDAIFNLAAQVSPVDGNKDPFTDLDVNCKGHLTVLEACRRFNPEARLIFSSSRFVYGPVRRIPVGEDRACDGTSIYAAHKLSGEKYHQFYHEAYGMPALIFRISHPYGPGQQMKHGRYGVLNWFIRQALEGRPLTVYGDGRQKRDYVYVDDLARGMLLGAAARSVPYGVFNIGSGRGLAFRDMAALVARKTGAKVKFVAWPRDRALVETGDYVGDLAKIRRVLGWEPLTPIEEGVERTVAFYREHGPRYFKAPAC